MSRLLLFQAGLAAASIQFIAAVSVTFAVFLTVEQELIVLAPPNIDGDIESKMDTFCLFCDGFTS